MDQQQAARKLREVFGAESISTDDSISNLVNNWPFLNDVIAVLRSLQRGECGLTEQFLRDCGSTEISQRMMELANIVTTEESHDRDAYRLRLSDLIRTLIATSLQCRGQGAIPLDDQKKAYYALVKHFVENEDFVVLYYDVNRIDDYQDHRRMKNKADLAEYFFSQLRQDVNGTYFLLPFWRRAIICSYILAMIALSLCSMVQNWGKRESLLERFTDGVSLFTIFAVSVFGLMKLSSEDPTVIRHTIEGVCYVNEVQSLCRALSIRYFFTYWDLVKYTDEDIKSILTCWKEPLGWLKGNDACFTGVAMNGDFLLRGGLRVSSALSRGILVSQRRICGINNRVHTISRSWYSSEGKQWLHVKDDGPNVPDSSQFDLVIGVSKDALEQLRILTATAALVDTCNTSAQSADPPVA